MCSYTVREARSDVDAFQVGSIAPAVVGTPDGLISVFLCNVADGFAWLTIPNTAIGDPSYCGGVLTNTALNTQASPVAGKIICTIEKIGQASFKKCCPLFDQLFFYSLQKIKHKFTFKLYGNLECTLYMI